MIHQHEEKLQVQESDLGEGSFVPFFMDLLKLHKIGERDLPHNRATYNAKT